MSYHYSYIIYEYTRIYGVYIYISVAERSLQKYGRDRVQERRKAYPRDEGHLPEVQEELCCPEARPRGTYACYVCMLVFKLFF